MPNQSVHEFWNLSMTISRTVYKPIQTEAETSSSRSGGSMASNLVQPASHVIHQVGRATKIATTPQSSVPAIRPLTGCPSYGVRCRPVYTTKVSESSSSLVGESNEIKAEKEIKAVGEIKEELYQLVQGTNRGIFGVPSSKKSQIHALVELLESQNPMPEPTSNLDKVGGDWKLVYSTITILGSRRTKLGLRDFITLGDFFQHIDVAESKAVNQIKFDVRGLNLLNGKLSIQASFDIASASRVNIKYENSTITPDQLMNVFRKNYDLLLGIFNPEGWLEITILSPETKKIIQSKLAQKTRHSKSLNSKHLDMRNPICIRYVDDNLRIGRDNNGNIFILERSEEYRRCHLF